MYKKIYKYFCIDESTMSSIKTCVNGTEREKERENHIK